MSIGEKIKNLRIKKELTQQEIGDFLGTTSQYISKLEKNKTTISDENIKKLEVFFEEKLTELSECVSLPLIEASAGGGYTQDNDKIISIARAELIELGFNKFDNIVGCKITGHSMQPTINNGDLLILDTNIGNLSDSDIYVINYGGELFCKRALKGLTYIKLKSDNPEYDTEKIEGQELEKLNIVGKVILRLNRF